MQYMDEFKKFDNILYVDSKLYNEEVNESIMYEAGGCMIEIYKDIGMAAFTTAEHNIFEWRKVMQLGGEPKNYLFRAVEQHVYLNCDLKKGNQGVKFKVD
jgi:hypothetical protein